MKSSEAFKQTIQSYLESRANTDELFAPSFAKSGKNIDDCCTYILNTVQKSGCNGFADDEVFGMAVHYYDEDRVEVGKPITGRVVVNHSVELTAEEIDETRQIAKAKLISEETARLQKKPEAKKPASKADPSSVQQCLMF